MAMNLILGAALAAPALLAAQQPAEPGAGPVIQALTPPERGFFSKRLDYHGIAIKAPAVVADPALHAAYQRLDLLLRHLPVAVTNLAAAGAELHIIGRHQVTTDLPEWRMDKHVPLDEYEGLTRDERTRGMGGLITSCGEENLLRLPRDQDRYFGRDICVHEFAHNLHGCGLDAALQGRIRQLAASAKAKGLWLDSYAGSNEFEFFAELTMWYFGGHGDLRMRGPRPGDGPEGLKQYDPESFAFLDDLYQGRLPIARSGFQPSPEDRGEGVPTDSQVARGIVARLTGYRLGATRLTDFLADAGAGKPEDEGRHGWHLVRLAPTGGADAGFRVAFQDPKQRNHELASLEFRAGILSGLRWNN